MPPPQATPEWFKTLVSIEPGGCWRWLGGKDPKGYGQIRLGGRAWKAHRLAFVLFNGPIPSGACVCHTCDNPSCVNPAHLWPGSTRENALDAVEKRRSHPNALAAPDRARVAELVRAGESKPAVARALGVTKRVIYKLARLEKL